MAHLSTMAPLLVAVLLGMVSFIQAQRPGSVFPFYDNCRRQLGNQRRDLKFVSQKTLPNGNAEFCFRVNVLKGQCTPEVLPPGMRAGRPISRCCDTTFTKIKFYANAACRDQFLPSLLTVPLAPRFNKGVSPIWEHTGPGQSRFTSIKYTQFGPIPQSLVDGTTFCLRVAAPKGGPQSSCDISNLANLANPAVGTRNQIMVSIYDKKEHNYECCPTWTFNTNTNTGSLPRPALVLTNITKT